MNRWYFWVLAPVMLASAVIIPMTGEPTSLVGHVLGYGVSGALVLGTLGLANPRRYNWALRMVAALVLAAGALYLFSELNAWRSGKPIGVFGRRSDSSLWNAIGFLVVFGLPAMRFLVSGRSNAAVDVIAVPEESEDQSNASSVSGEMSGSTHSARASGDMSRSRE